MLKNARDQKTAQAFLNRDTFLNIVFSPHNKFVNSYFFRSFPRICHKMHASQNKKEGIAIDND